MAVLLAAPLVLAAALLPADAALAQTPAARHAAAKKAAAPAGPVRFLAPDYVIGDPKAPVTVIEYLSNTCGHCAAFDKGVWPQAKAAYVDTGKVKWVVREFLTPPEQVAAAGFVLARCAGKDRYFATIEALFRAQDEMARTGQVRSILLRIAKDQGVDEARFDACLNDQAAFAALNARVDHAITVDKVEATPTIFINGRKVFDSLPSYTELAGALAQAGVP